MTPPIVVSAVVIRDNLGRVLVVRKRGTQRLMLPGGKREAGESAEQTAVREFAEEVGAELDAAQLRLLGEFTADAANEPGRRVHASVYEHPWVTVDSPRAEIEHMEWVDPASPAETLAPLLRTVIFPLLRERHP